MSKELIKANGILQQASFNSWLKIILNEEFNYNLNKQQFLDAERLRHTLLCQKGGFAILPYDKLRDITGASWHDVAIKPILQPVINNNVVPSTTNTSYGAWLDVNAKR